MFSSKSSNKSSGSSKLLDAQSYLQKVNSKVSLTSAGRARANSRSSSLLSYATTQQSPAAVIAHPNRSRSSSLVSSSWSSDDGTGERPAGWLGLNSVMPLPSHVSATRQPTTAFDSDFIPNPQDPYSLRHSEYGYDVNPQHRTISQPSANQSLAPSDEEPSIWTYFGTYLSYALLFVLGHIRDFFGKWLLPNEFVHLKPSDVSHTRTPSTAPLSAAHLTRSSLSGLRPALLGL